MHALNLTEIKHLFSIKTYYFKLSALKAIHPFEFKFENTNR